MHVVLLMRRSGMVRISWLPALLAPPEWVKELR